MDKVRKFRKFFILKDWVLCLMFLIAAAFPLGNMGEVSVESSYKIIYMFLSHLSKSDLNKEYIFGLLIGSLGLIFGAILTLPFLKRYKSHFKIPGLTVRLICLIVFCISFIIGANYIFKFYGLTSNVFIPIMIVYGAVEAVSLVIRYFVFRNMGDKEVKVEEEYSVAEGREDIADKTVKVKRKYSLNKIFDGLYFIFSAVLMLIICTLICPTGIDYGSNYTPNFRGTLYENVLNHDLGESFLGYVGVDDDYKKNFMLNFEEGSTHVLNYKSNNYIYWQKKLKEKQDELIELMPDYDSNLENDLKVYTKKIEKLIKEISTINENLETLNYENVKIKTVAKKEVNGSTTDFYANIIEIVYDTQYHNPLSGIKWDNKENKRLFCNQSIQLAQNEFNANTDFSSVKIGATIKYYDGSVKKCYIIPSNYEELNNAEKGRHTIKWADDWGSYEYEINII